MNPQRRYPSSQRKPREWQLWRKPEPEGGGLTSARSYRRGPPLYVIRAWTPKQAWFFAFNAASHLSSARTDGLGVFGGTALDGPP